MSEVEEDEDVVLLVVVVWSVVGGLLQIVRWSVQKMTVKKVDTTGRRCSLSVSHNSRCEGVC